MVLPSFVFIILWQSHHCFPLVFHCDTFLCSLQRNLEPLSHHHWTLNPQLPLIHTLCRGSLSEAWQMGILQGNVVHCLLPKTDNLSGGWYKYLIGSVCTVICWLLWHIQILKKPGTIMYSNLSLDEKHNCQVDYLIHVLVKDFLPDVQAWLEQQDVMGQDKD